MRIVIHPCLHLHDELEVSVTNFRGGDAINLNLLFFQHMIQEKPDEIKKVSGVLQLHKYCGEYEHGDGGGVYVNKAVVIDDDTEDDSEEDTEYSGHHSGDGDDYDYKYGVDFKYIDDLSTEDEDSTSSKYSEKELIAYSLVGALSGILLMVLLTGGVVVIVRKRRRDRRHYAVTTELSARMSSRSTVFDMDDDEWT